MERDFTVTDPSESDWLCFGAAMMAIRVFVNGQLVGEHTGGYTPFEFDVSAALRPGANSLCIHLLGEQSVITPGGTTHPVSVSSATLSGRSLQAWKDETGMERPPERLGIWQDVYFEQRAPTHLKRTRITNELESSTVSVYAELNRVPTERDTILRWEICDADGKLVTDGYFTEGIEGADLEFSIAADELKPWSPDHPTLYHLNISLLDRDGVVDKLTMRFGYRSFTVNGADFRLNGAPLVLRGESNLLQNRGLQFSNPFAVEAPEFWDLAHCRAYFKKLKAALDINCLRVHGSIGHPAIFEAADEVGLLLINQSSIWSRGYGGYKANSETFFAAAKNEFHEWIWRDVNHPSVVIWAAENEMTRIAPDAEAARPFLKLRDFIRQIDPSRPVTFDGGSGAMGEATEIYHIHHEETYEPILEHWQRDKPVIFGEFWIGSRGAEQRLTTGEEYLSREDYLSKQWELWRQRIEPLRMAGASGVFPYNFSAQWIRRWSHFRPYFNARDRASWGEIGLRVQAVDPASADDFAIDADLARKWRHLLGRYCVGFATTQRSFGCEKDGQVALKIQLRNDDSAVTFGTVRLICEGALASEQTLSVAPFSTVSTELNLPCNAQSAMHVRLEWIDAVGRMLDCVEDTFHRIEPQDTFPTNRVVYLLADTHTKAISTLLNNAGVSYHSIRPEALDWSSMAGGILLASSQALDAQPNWRQAVHAHGIGCLIFADTGGAPTIFGLQRLTFNEPLGHAWKFEPMLGRKLKLNDMLLPRIGTWETDSSQRRLRDPYWRALSHGDVVAGAVLLHPGGEVSEVMRIVHNVGAGLDGDEAAAHEQAQIEAPPRYFRSLMTGSRREYSLAAEVSDGKGKSIVTTCHFDASPEAETAHTALLSELLHNLDDETISHAPPPFDTIQLLDDCSHRPREELEAFDVHLKRVEGIQADLVSIDSRSVFAATKCLALINSKACRDWLTVESSATILGGWLGLQTPSSFEISGPLFPWEYNSPAPIAVGYLGVAILNGRTLKIALMDKLDIDVAYMQHLRSNLTRVRAQAIEIVSPLDAVS